MLDWMAVERTLKCVPIAREVDSPTPGLLRISTCFRYPDGGAIDVYVEREDGFPELAQVKVSDLGETFAWLSDMAIDPWKTRRRRKFLEDVLRVLEVHHQNGELFRRVDGIPQIADAVLRVGQAALRVSDLIYTQRLVQAPELQESFQELLEAHEFPYEENVKIETPTREVVIPYAVSGRSSTSWVQLVPARSQSAHQIANEVTLRWLDLSELENPARRVTVIDDEGPGLRDYDLAHLQRFSDVIPWSDRSTLVESLAT
ncbi:MAG: DUF1828 domain-containing protein [Armatimonadota bacterium]